MRLIIGILLISNFSWARCDDIVYSSNRWSFDGVTTYRLEDNIKKASSSGCDLNKKLECIRSPIKVSALSCAVLTNNINAVKFLIKESVDLDSKDELGETPLSYAIRTGNVQAVRELMSAGAEYKGVLEKINSNTRGTPPEALYAVAIQLFKENGSFDHCKYTYQQTSQMFFIAQAMSREDPKDKKLAEFTSKLKGVSTQAGYNRYASHHCVLAAPRSESGGATK